MEIDKVRVKDREKEALTAHSPSCLTPTFVGRVGKIG